MFTLQQANEYIKRHKSDVNLKYRLKYHMMPTVGWMNDPNGLIQYKGEYHLFYQYYPYDAVWGPMHWGHATSKDLLKWTDQEVALAPDQSYESGCFSGGAIVKDDELYLMYTSHIEAADNDGVQKQTQSIAISHDGKTFVKYADNPVIKESAIPEGASNVDFRDPNPFYRYGNYYVLVGSKTEQEMGQLLVYQSKDLINWEYLNKIGPHPMFGIMAECPDLFHLDGKDVILMSSIQLKSDDNKYRNVNSCIYIVGEFDSKTGSFEIEFIDEIDTGHDFYAPQTLEDEQGRRIMIGWMEMWGKEYLTHKLDHKWTGAMTLPRVLKLEGSQLIQQPILEASKLRTKAKVFNNVEFNGETSIGFLMDKCSELVLKGRVEKELMLKFSQTEDDFFTIKITDNQVMLDTMTSQLYPQEPRWVYSPVDTEDFDLRIYFDQSSIEIFAYEGKRLITTRIYFEDETYSLEVTGEQSTLEILEYFELTLE